MRVGDERSIGLVGRGGEGGHDDPFGGALKIHLIRDRNALVKVYSISVNCLNREYPPKQCFGRLGNCV